MTTLRLSFSNNTLGREQPQADSNAKLRFFSACVESELVDYPPLPIGDPPDDDKQDEPQYDRHDEDDEEEDDEDEEHEDEVDH